MFTFKKFLILVSIAFPLAAAMATGIYLYKNLPLKTAKYYLQAGDFEAALASIDDYLATYPTDPYARSIKAQVQSRRMRHIQAVDIYHEIGPAEQEDYRCFLMSLFATRQWNYIPQVSRAYHQQFGNDADVWRWTAISYLHLGDWDQALEASRQLTQIKGSSHIGWALQGDCHASKNNRNRAFDCWEKSVELNPSVQNLHRSPEDFLKHFCESLLAEGKPKRAIRLLKEKSQVPLTPELHFLLGKCFLSTGQIKEAKKQWIIASRCSLHVSSLVSLAKQLIKENRYSDSLEVIQAIQYSSVVNMELAELLILIHRNLKNEDKLKYWQTVAGKLRKIQKVEDQMQHFVLENPTSEIAILFNSYFLCREGNWIQAAASLRSVSRELRQTESGISLQKCILNRQINSEVLEQIRKQFHFNSSGDPIGPMN